MDDEKKKDAHWEGPVFVALFVLVLLQFLSGLPTYIEDAFGVSGGFFSTLFETNKALTLDTPIGTKIITTSESSIWSEPGGGLLIAETRRGIPGTIVGGPVFRDGVLWWQVEYRSGTTGWTSGGSIVIDTENDRKALKETTPHGTKVENVAETTVYSSPSPEGLVVGNKERGEEATIVGGSVTRDNERWWQVEYDDGTVGWVREQNLQIDVSSNIQGVNDTTPLETEIINVMEERVWSAPRGGRELGIQEINAIGILVDGAVTIGTKRWWDVDYETGVDGWVLESGLERKFSLKEAVNNAAIVFKRISYIISFLFLTGIVYVFVQLRKETSKEYHMFKPLSVLPRERDVKNRKWERVLLHIESDNPGDWRLAVLEADILLDEVVGTMGLTGDTLGERLMAVEQSDFTTINKAWEAHKMRNAVAHQGGDYILTQREARRTIDLYKQVFEEFHFI